MKTTLSLSPAAQLETECLVAVVLDRAENAGGEKDKTEVFVSAADKAVQQAAAEIISSGDVAAKTFETTWLHNPTGLKAKRLLLVGGGKAASSLLRICEKLPAPRCAPKTSQTTQPGVRCSRRYSADDAVRAIVEGAFVGNFDPDTYKSDRKDQKVDSLTIVAARPAERIAARRRRSPHHRRVAELHPRTGERAVEPHDADHPGRAARRKMAKEDGLKCEVYGADKIKELKMGAFWGVAQGSDEPPALIVMRYEPAGAPEKPVLGLVGKGITFDTGGISIKPADGMEKMKYDMAGGATMIGAMRAIALLKPKVQGHRDRLRHGKHALRQGAEARRRADRDVRQDDRDHQHRRRRPPRARRRPLLRAPAWLHASDRRRHAHRRGCCCARVLQRWSLCQRRRLL